MECSRRRLFFVKQKTTGIWLTWPALVNFYIHFNLAVTSNSITTHFVKPVEGSPKSSLSWKFDLSSTNLVILQATVSCPGTTYEDGEIIWKICGPDHCQILENGKRLILTNVKNHYLGCSIAKKTIFPWKQQAVLTLKLICLDPSGVYWAPRWVAVEETTPGNTLK